MPFALGKDDGKGEGGGGEEETVGKGMGGGGVMGSYYPIEQAAVLATDH